MCFFFARSVHRNSFDFFLQNMELCDIASFAYSYFPGSVVPFSELKFAESCLYCFNFTSPPFKTRCAVRHIQSLNFMYLHLQRINFFLKLSSLFLKKVGNSIGSGALMIVLFFF